MFEIHLQFALLINYTFHTPNIINFHFILSLLFIMTTLQEIGSFVIYSKKTLQKRYRYDNKKD